MENPLSQIRARTGQLVQRLSQSIALKESTPAEPKTFRQAYDEGIEEGMRLRFERLGRELHPHQAPELHRVVEEMSAKLGVEKPQIYIPDHRVTIQHGGDAQEVLHTISMESNCGAMPIGKPRMVLGGNFLRMMTGDASGRVLNDEVKAVIGHEMGHLKYDRGLVSGLTAGRLAPYAMPIAAISGLAAYNYLQKNPAHKQEVENQMDIDPETGDRHFHTRVGQHNNALHSMTGYLVAGMLGYGAGMLTWRHMNRMVEFRADRTSAELMGSGQPLIRAFEKLQTEAHKMYGEAAKGLRKAIGEGKVTVEETKKFDKMQADIGRWTYPTMEERIQRLDDFSR
ncbi:MAG: M48 family metalloprotease [Rickettsiales bacterium]|nr:M48 family metalloprotease [Rickettsiales bacterium]